MANTVVVGIDLGTTNSVIAVPGQYADKGIVFGNITVVGDEFERTTHASAVCKVDGEMCVGDDAKALASEGYTPVRFMKKYMGTEKKFRVGEEEWVPEQVSAEVLRHLCRVVEKRLGVKVTGAVITHPAYFDGVAIQATQEAGIQAGLKVAGLLMEPVAAAMAYCDEDERTNLRVLVYDLGGGTFDITLVERSGAAFRPVSFGGDRELGGYNFDKKIATEMLKALRDKGYTLNIDTEQPERDPRWAALMHYAEEMKFKLSAEGSNRGVVRVPNVFKDDSKPPKAVQLAFTMTREEFLQLIAPEIDKTIRETRKVLATANLTAEDIDLLVMVGGSSRLRAIGERLQKEFGLDPQFDEDVLDLSVAVGAAMVAAAAGTTEEGVTLNTIPEETDETEIVFSGRVAASEKCDEVANLTVTVSGGATGEETTMTSADGKFYLEVGLEEETDNALTFRVEGPGGQPIVERTFVVSQTRDSDGRPVHEPPPAMLPKPIAVETESGFSTLAEEGVTLPYKGTKAFQTARELTEIHVNLFQEDVQLSTILLTGFSQPVPANCRVELEFEIGSDYAMKAKATVPSASIEKTQEVKLQPLAVPSIEELRDEFRDVRQEFESRLENMPDGEQKAKLGAEGDMIVEDIESLLSAEFPEKLQAFMLIKKLYLLMKQATAVGLTPPKTEVDAKFQEARDLLTAASTKNASIREQNYGPILETLESEAHRAYQQNDEGAWGRVAAKLDDIIGDLKRALSGGGGGGGIDQIPLLHLMAFLMQEINNTRQELMAKSGSGAVSPANAARAKQELDSAQQKANQLDMSNESAAKQQIVAIYQQHVAAAKQLVGVVEAGLGADLKEA